MTKKTFEKPHVEPHEDRTYYTCTAGNVRTGISKSGNPYVKIGCVIKSGPRKGEWLNYFRSITPKTKEMLKKDLATMGVTLGEGDDYSLDRRLFTVVWGYDAYWKEDGILSVRESKFKPDVVRVDLGDDQEVF